MIGALFANNFISDDKFNVMIFMKPYILHSMGDFDRITEQEEDLFKTENVLPDVKQSINSATEMIKSIE